MGPLNPGTATGSPSYQKVFTCRPSKASEEPGCARKILTSIARRAYRRPVTDEDLSVLMGFYAEGRANGTFDTGIELGLQRILVSPSFLFRAEFAPAVGARRVVPRSAT